MRILLDTCTFLWICAGAAELSVAARQLFVEPANEVYLSVISGWEIALKHSLGRLPLPARPERFVPEQRALHAVESLPLDEASVLQIGKLPTHHRDPFDRMLVCQAITHGLVVLTPDPQIAQYPVRTYW